MEAPDEGQATSLLSPATEPAKPINRGQFIDAKTLMTFQARACLLGCCLIRTENDRGQEVFIITREAMCKELDGPEAIDAWIKRLGGPAA